jgi:hypothetical protein
MEAVELFGGIFFGIEKFVRVKRLLSHRHTQTHTDIKYKRSHTHTDVLS